MNNNLHFYSNIRFLQKKKRKNNYNNFYKNKVNVGKLLTTIMLIILVIAYYLHGKNIMFVNRYIYTK